VATKLLNVRLDPEDVRRVAALRRKGVEVSALVRIAIRDEYRRLCGNGRKRNARQILQEIFELYPEPADRTPADCNIHDRHAFAESVANHLRRRGRA
jgi:hypothetical protein